MLHIPLPCPSTAQEGDVMKRPGLPWRVIGCGLVLLSALLYADVATAQLTVNQSSVNFGSVPAGSSATQALVLGNSGGSSLTVSQATVTAPFSLGSLPLPLTLAAGQSASFSVVFAPQSSGSVSGSLSLVSWTPVLHGTNGKHNGSNNTTTTVPLSGAGASLSTASTTPGQLVASPSSLSFGSVQVSNSVTLSEAVTNTGGSNVTVAQATAAGTGFSISGLNLPLTLAAGQSVTFSATFTPLSGGSAAGSVSVSSDALNATLMIALAGTGTALRRAR